MEKLTKIQQDLLTQIADLHHIPSGAFSLRIDGKSAKLSSTEDIIITPKNDKSGIDILVKSTCQNKSMHIPVIIAKSGVKEVVYNTFTIEEDAIVTIVAGCGIHNCGTLTSEHNGIHTFNIGANARVKYIEKHVGIGESHKNLSPKTVINLGENSVFEMETAQVSGVDFADRSATATLNKNSKLIIKEKILTSNNETAKTNFLVTLLGENSAVEVISRAVARDNSFQEFSSELVGKNACYGRVECDGIILNKAKIYSLPIVKAEDLNASLSHEAQIGKIASEELTKLMTLGLTEKESEEMIIRGYLK